MGSWLFRNLGKVNAPKQSVAALRIQTSIDGKPIPVGYGKMRIATNVVWEGVFLSYPPAQQSGTAGGGKGFAGFGSAQNPSSQDYTYSVWAILGLCEGPINSNDPLHVWFNKAQASWDRATANNAQVGVVQGYFGFTLFDGTYSQTAASAMTSIVPGYDLNYRGLCYVLSDPMYLGSTAELPNITIDVEFALSRAIPISYGADPRDIISDVLTNTHYGVGFPGANIDANTTYSSYCKATGLVLSPFLAEQRPAADFLKEWAQATNSEFIWTGGVLKVIPYGDQNITANGSTYTAPGVLNVSLTDDDILAGNSSNEPILVERKRNEDMINSIKIEYLGGENGAGDYDPMIADAKEDAAIQIYGLKPQNTIQMHFITEAAAATLSAQLLLGREQILNTYTFTVSGRNILLDPMDVVSITDGVLGIQELPVRIKEITENEDYSLTVVAEDYPAGAASSPAYATQPNSGFAADYNVAPGNTLNPVIFEPPIQLSKGLEIWGAVTGEDLDNWGGCQVWVSSDGDTFIPQGEIRGQSRVGTLADLISKTGLRSHVTIDTHGSMEVDLTISQGQLSSVSVDDWLAFASLMWVDGEFIAYLNSTPVDTYKFILSTLNRGGYGSAITDHAAGAYVARLDNSIFKIPYTADRIGKPIYLKFLSFNKYGGSLQSLSDVGAAIFNITGLAYAAPATITAPWALGNNPQAPGSPSALASNRDVSIGPDGSATDLTLPNVTGFSSVFIGNTLQFVWNEISDARAPILYEIRSGGSGDDWATGFVIGRFAHAHIPQPALNTFLVKSFYSPDAGVITYCPTASRIVTAPVSFSKSPSVTIGGYHLLDSAVEGVPPDLPGKLSDNISTTDTT